MTCRRACATPGASSLIFEPRDAWIGVFAGPGAVYVALVPFLVLRWERNG